MMKENKGIDNIRAASQPDSPATYLTGRALARLFAEGRILRYPLCPVSGVMLHPEPMDGCDALGERLADPERACTIRRWWGLPVSAIILTDAVLMPAPPL